MYDDIALELGTRGVHPDHLTRYLQIADALGATLLRSMVQRGPDKPDLATSARLVASMVPELEQRGVTLALETYEQVSTTDLLTVVAGDAAGLERAYALARARTGAA